MKIMVRWHDGQSETFDWLDDAMQYVDLHCPSAIVRLLADGLVRVWRDRADFEGKAEPTATIRALGKARLVLQVGTEGEGPGPDGDQG
jgi:hypothetical protein